MTTDKIAVRKSMAPRREKRLLCEIDVMANLSTKGNTIGQSLPKRVSASKNGSLAPISRHFRR
jgi:hypothetical protein